jgi:hypothetical protein
MTSAVNPAVENRLPANLASVIPLFWEIGNLKRVSPANLHVSFAADLFLQSWSNIAGGAKVRDVAIKVAAGAVAAAQLGAINQAVLRRAELNEAEIQTILKRSFDLSSAPIEKNLREELRAALLMREFDAGESGAPPFAEKLARQPRSGATKPNAPRLVFDAPENHAEHVITVAVYAVLLAPFLTPTSPRFFSRARASFSQRRFARRRICGRRTFGRISAGNFQQVARAMFARTAD